VEAKARPALRQRTQTDRELVEKQARQIRGADFAGIFADSLLLCITFTRHYTVEVEYLGPRR